MAILALLVSCSEEEIVKVTPTNGQEVKFSVSMDKVASRTLYGAVADDGKSIKVNWVDGDEITVFGTTCAVQQANYSQKRQAARAATAPSAQAVVNWRISFVRQSPAAKIPAAEVRQFSPAGMKPAASATFRF